MKSKTLLILSLLLSSCGVLADVKTSAMFGPNMVLQQKQPNRIWGWAEPGENVTVKIADQTKKTQAGSDGMWKVTLDSLEAGGPHVLTIGGKNSLTYDNVLIGEVWVCSGQSNMAWPVRAANDPDLESMTAKYPQIRLISVPRVGTQDPQSDFEGEWQECTPDSVQQFSAVGYFFGRQLHRTLDVPIGLINNAWGGSACEAWINRDVLDSDGRFSELMANWKKVESEYDSGAARARYEEQLSRWEKRAQDARKNKKAVPRRPRFNNLMVGNQRPSNIYNGVLKPTIGYGIRGTIWYQGESNASRAYQYRDLFPLMIQSWRDEWGQGDFSFYWVQLADFRAEKAEPADSDWAELREAQTMTMSKLPNTGEAVIIDLGEASDIHPRNKQDVAKRLARWALAKDYGYENLVYRSPTYKSMEIKGKAVIMTFDGVGTGLDTFDVAQPRGFTIAGDDRVFHHAQAQVLGSGTRNQIRVWSDKVPVPVAVRYAWADNPICNLQNREGLPATPFRTDEWEGVTKGKNVR